MLQSKTCPANAKALCEDEGLAMFKGIHHESKVLTQEAAEAAGNATYAAAHAAKAPHKRRLAATAAEEEEGGCYEKKQCVGVHQVGHSFVWGSVCVYWVGGGGGWVVVGWGGGGQLVVDIRNGIQERH
jgi:hypothetical protein